MRVLAFLLTFAALPTLAQPTAIGTIQGSGAAATAGTFTVEGVVTAVYPNLSPAGYYVQNDAASADRDPATSDALFVVAAAPTVAVGNRLRLTGAVQESGSFPAYNQAVMTSASVTVLAASAPRPAPVLLANATFSVAAMEAYEGMLVEFASPLTVTSVAAIKSSGQLTLSANGLVYQPTQMVDPNDSPASGTSSSGSSNVAAVTAYAAARAAQSITLDDGVSATNPTPIPYLDPVLGTVRVGSTVAGLRAIVSQRNARYLLQPLPGAEAPAVAVTRPAVPAFAPFDVKLASFNVLNYFNGDGAGGGFPTSRGAATPVAFQRQRAKIIVALTQLNADAVGLMEIENDGTGPASAIQDLVSGLNAATAPGTWALIDDGATQQPGTSDLIRCAIIYKPGRLMPVGPVRLGGSSTFERAPVAQVFATAAGQQFALVVNHFKSKASGTGANADQGDGQGRSNLRRTQQAQALELFLRTVVAPTGSPNIISVGDYNANYEEDPMDALRAAGLLTPSPPTSVSYVFNGLSGSLDHAVITPNLANAVEIHKWNINSVEPEFLEYDAAGAATDLSSPFRSSDHDPVLIALSFSRIITSTRLAGTAAPTLAVFPNPASGAFGFELRGAPAGPLTLTLLSALGQPVLTLQGAAAEVRAALLRQSGPLAAGLYVLRVRGSGWEAGQRVVKQ